MLYKRLLVICSNQTKTYLNKVSWVNAYAQLKFNKYASG